MELRLRSTRTLKVTEITVSGEEREQLAQLGADPRYEALLNTMERACISLETAHLNTPVGDPETVLGGHLLCKGAWLFFAYIQKQVLNAVHTRDNQEETREEPSFDDIIQGVE